MEAIVCQVVGATSNSLKVIPIAAIPLPSTSNYTSSSNLEGNTAPYTFNYTSAATKHLNDSWMNELGWAARLGFFLYSDEGKLK